MTEHTKVTATKVGLGTRILVTDADIDGVRTLIPSTTTTRQIVATVTGIESTTSHLHGRARRTVTFKTTEGRVPDLPDDQELWVEPDTDDE